MIHSEHGLWQHEPGDLVHLLLQVLLHFIHLLSWAIFALIFLTHAAADQV